MEKTDKHCQIPGAIQKILAASYCNVAYLGGSLTIAAGASNSAETSWRALFQKYLYQRFHPVYQSQVGEIMGAMGANESFGSAFTLGRNVLPFQPTLAFVEFAVNDRGSPRKDLVQKGMEGIVRQLLLHKKGADVVILGMGCRPGTDNTNETGAVDHSIHREVAEYYDLPFIDFQGYIYDKLKERGQAWDDVSIDFEENDPVHLNDYGNQLCFEAMRDCFEEQFRLYLDADPKPVRSDVPPPMVSDELQFVKLLDPSKKNSGVELEGTWNLKPQGMIPWYFDHVLAGCPGAKMRLRFMGTAAAVMGLVYNNGLKVHATIDGEEVPGPFLRHVIEFGKITVLAHGLPEGEHVLEMKVGEPSQRHNKLQNPRAQIAYLGIANREE